MCCYPSLPWCCICRIGFVRELISAIRWIDQLITLFLIGKCFVEFTDELSTQKLLPSLCCGCWVSPQKFINRQSMLFRQNFRNLCAFNKGFNKQKGFITERIEININYPAQISLNRGKMLEKTKIPFKRSTLKEWNKKEKRTQNKRQEMINNNQIAFKNRSSRKYIHQQFLCFLFSLWDLSSFWLLKFRYFCTFSNKTSNITSFMLLTPRLIAFPDWKRGRTELLKNI